MPLPDFLIAGVPKAGTTALHTALRRHPDLFLSRVKEPKFFLTDGPPPHTGGPGDADTYREHVWRRTDYEALFTDAPPGALTGESTPFYLYDTAAQRRIHALIPEVKIILTLRDPVERAHSNWTHLWSAGLEPIGDLVRACEAEPKRIADGWGHFWHYTGLGRYGEQLAHLFSLFPREQVLIFRYRDVVDRPATTLDQVCAFLCVRTGLLTEVPRQNVTAHPRACSSGAARPAARWSGSSGSGSSPASPTTSGCSRSSPATTTATGSGTGRAPAASSASGRPASGRRATAAGADAAPPGQRSSVRSSCAPSARVNS
ncbi:sulfotransferase family protein [Nonomuraea ceibae]|uniref:sulfotransferase family protein n=1 Tax=Nonomuraea ceibae TaxID=1935170 RepID=UPI0027DF0497|nr:sulfotransferase [Nonomuraea ceibae]